MNRPWTALAVMLVLPFAGLRPALAAPPTVTPSPGYDARLQEQHKAMSASSPTLVQPAAPFTTNTPRHRSRRKH